MKKLFLSLLLTLLSVATWALTFSSGQFKYTTITSSLVEITGYNSSVSSSGLKDLVIPRTVTYNGKTYDVTKVTGLGSSQFPESVSVEFSLKDITIGQDAFKGCRNLKTVKLRSNVYQISANAFFDCPNLTEFQVTRPTALTGSAAIFNSAITVKIPYTADLAAHQASAIFSTSGVTVKQALGVYDFQANGMALARTETSAVAGNVRVVGRVATTSTTWNIPATATLTDIGTFTITGIAPYANAVEGSNLTTLSISGNLLEIGESAFRGNANLTNVSIVSGSVKTIEKDAFKNCSALTKLSLENAKVEKIGATIVTGCSSLTQVELPSSLTSLNTTAFYGAANLKNITVNSNSTNFESYSGWLYNKGKTKLICCPPANTSNGWATTVKTIGSYAFSYTQRTSIRIPYGVTTITSYAFYYAPKVKDIYIPSSVTSLGTTKTFYYCSSLQGFFINMKSMPTITSTTFEQSNYKNAFLYVHNGLAGTYKANTYWKQFKEIDRGAYDLFASSGGYNVTSSSTAEAVTLIDPSIPASISDAQGRSYTVTAVADSAALGASDLMVGTLTGPNVTSVGKNAFYNCSQLTAVNLPKVKTLGVGAFSRCSTLQTVTLPTTMTAIGENCFQFCSALTSIRWPLGVKDILGAQFVSSGLTTFEAPYGVETIGEGCFQNCQQLTRIVLPSTVKSVGAWAFMQCSSLTDLVVNRTTPPTKTGSGGLFGETASSNNAYLRTPVSAVNTYKNNSTWSGQFKSGHITAGGYDFATNDNYGLTVTALPSSSSTNGNVTAVYKYRTSVRPTIDMTGTLTDAWGRTFNITALGDNLFAGTNVQIVHFPTSVTKIPNHCFDGCTQITNLNYFTMPNVTAFGDQAFANCTNLQSVNLQGITTLGQGVFLRCSKLQTVNMPTTMTAIGQDCFQFCSALTSIRWPLGVKDILGAQFVSSGLTTFEAPYGVETIGEGCFQNCQQLTRIVLPSTVKSVGAWAFMQCSSLTDLVVNRTTPPTKTGSGGLFGETASSNNAYLRTPVSAVNTYKNNSTWSGQFKSGHITAGGYDFATNDNYGLTVTALPSSSSSNGKATAVYKVSTSSPSTVTVATTATDNWGRTFDINALGNNLFAGSTLQKAILPSFVTKIPDYCFDGCTQITTTDNVTMTNVTELGDHAFANCTGLTTANLTKVTKLGQGVFLKCSKLQTVTLPTTMTAIGQDCFQFCSALTSIRWPLGVKDILGAQFVSSGLTTFEAPYGVETIGEGCFQNCQQLTRIVLPSTVKSVGAWAFMQCSSLTDLVVNRTTPPTKTGSGGLFGETASSNNAYLRTPVSAVNTYKNNSTWSGQFKSGHITPGGYDFATSDNYGLTVTALPSSSNGKVTAVYKYRTSVRPAIDMTGTETDAWGRTFNITALGDSLFAGTNVQTVKFPTSVTKIPNHCFDGCTQIVNLNNFSMPNVTAVGDQAFANCTRLVAANLTKVTTLGQGVFLRCSKLQTVTLPTTMTAIGQDCFQFCSALTSIRWPLGVKDILGAQFVSSGLTTFEAPYGVETIGEGCFQNCQQLTRIVLPSTVKSVGAWAFMQCGNLIDLIVNSTTPPTKTGSGSLFGESASSNNSYLRTPLAAVSTYKNNSTWNGQFKNGHITAGGYDFLGTSNLALTVTIAPTNGNKGAAKAVYKAHTAGENTSDVDTRETFADAWNREFKVMELEDSCFAGTLAGHVTLSNNVTRLPNNCFDGSFTIVSFDDITMPGVTEIGDEAFANCQSFNPKTVPAQVTKLGSGVFKNCTAIDEMTLPNTVTSIGRYLFHGCANMKSVALSTSLISVPELTFNGCASLTEVHIPLGVYSMGAGVFAFCTNLKKVTIPSSVEVIRTTNWKGEDEWGMFFNCSNLEKVIMNIQTPKKLSARDSWLFGMPASATANDGPKTNAWLYVPNGCAQAYRESDYYNRFLDDRIVDGAYDIKLGDVNGDGNVTPADAIMILYRYFNVEQSGFIANMADLNKDGFISPADAIETLYMYFNSSGSRTPKASKAAEALLQEIIQTIEPE